MGTKLSTGISALDRRLDGGLKPGDIVALVAPPATQSHTLIHQMMQQRPTVYVTTLRSESSIQRDFWDITNGQFECKVVELGSETSGESKMLEELTGSRTYSPNSLTASNPLDDIYETLDDIDQQVNLVIDPINMLERGDDREAYANALKKLNTTMEATGSIGVLHCLTLNDPPAFREESLIVADVVWELDVVSTTKSDVEFQLRIPKNRGGEALLEEMTLQIRRDGVYVDDSRGI